MHNPIQLEALFALKLSADVELLGRRLCATKKTSVEAKPLSLLFRKIESFSKIFYDFCENSAPKLRKSYFDITLLGGFTGDFTSQNISS